MQNVAIVKSPREIIHHSGTVDTCVPDACQSFRRWIALIKNSLCRRNLLAFIIIIIIIFFSFFFCCYIDPFLLSLLPLLRSVSTTRVHGRSSRPVNSGAFFDTRQPGPSTRVVERKPTFTPRFSLLISFIVITIFIIIVINTRPVNIWKIPPQFPKNCYKRFLN